MAKIFFEDDDEEIEVPDGSSLHKPCEGQGVPFSCTEGTCGTCKITVTEGMENLSDYNEKEQNLLGDLRTKRLACQCQIKQGTIKLKY